MAITITRTPWQDDDGTGTTGTVLNNAVKTDLYNQIDAALAKAAQLAGGNAFTGNQTIAGATAITGTLTVNGAGPHVFSASIPGGGVVLGVRNTAGTVSTTSEIQIGNDTDARLLLLNTYSSTWVTATYAWANGGSVYAGGAGGLSIAAAHAAGSVRVYTNSLERMRIAATGEVLINTITNPNGAQLAMFVDGGTRPNGIAFQNTSLTLMNFMAFINSAGGVAGLITQTGQTTVAYNTASDARLKDDAGRAVDLEALRGVVVHDFTWKADGRRARGVFAQEAAAVFPAAITEGADDVTDGGALARPWMTDYSKFVPDLIVGWQQHETELAELRAALAAKG